MREERECDLLAILAYLRSVLDDPRLTDEAWLELAPRPHLRAELRPGARGEPPATLACELAHLDDLALRRLIYRRRDRHVRVSITPSGRDALRQDG